jgi:PPOX class probable F420-dependent enzyme
MYAPVQDPTQALQLFVRQSTILLTTFRRDGTPVGTPVHIAVEGDHAYVRTWSTSGKAKRLRHDQTALIAPSTIAGSPTGAPVEVRARVLSGEESAHAGRLLARKYPLLHGFLIPLMHRLMGYVTTHVELQPIGG